MRMCIANILFCITVIVFNLIQVNGYSLNKGHAFINIENTTLKGTNDHFGLKSKVGNTTTHVNSTVKSVKTASNDTKSKLPLIKPKPLDKKNSTNLTIPINPISIISNVTQALAPPVNTNNNNNNTDDITKLKSDIINIMKNIESVALNLKDTSLMTNDILKSLSNLKTEFYKIEYEYTVYLNENHKRVSLLNERLSANMIDQFKHQLFILNQSFAEMTADLKKDQEKVALLEHDIYLNSKCLSYDTCFKCSSDPLCGWCSSTSKCIEGNAEGPILSKCPIYSYSICDNESYCNKYTCDECIANILCSWCSQSTKPFCSKANENITCMNKDLIVNLLGENNICPNVNLRKDTIDDDSLFNFEREAQNNAKRKVMLEEYNQLKKEIEIKKDIIQSLKAQENKIMQEIKIIEQQRNDFKIIEEDKQEEKNNEEYKRKMMNVFKTDLQSLFESLKQKLHM